MTTHDAPGAQRPQPLAFEEPREEMRRTQIYLGRRERDALLLAMRRTRRTRSSLIREAIGVRYIERPYPGNILAAVQESVGAWRRGGWRPDGRAQARATRDGRPDWTE